MPKTQRFNLEKSLTQIENIISILEDEQATLQDSLRAFEEGIKLTREAQQNLLEAEQKVKLLLEANDRPDPREFSETDGK